MGMTLVQVVNDELHVFPLLSSKLIFCAVTFLEVLRNFEIDQWEKIQQRAALAYPPSEPLFHFYSFLCSVSKTYEVSDFLQGNALPLKEVKTELQTYRRLYLKNF